ncbi:MAG: Rpp14/Pop5 family protein [Candidatus Thorarchaeota archaeon]
MKKRRKRYLLFRLHGEESITRKELSQKIWKNLLSIYGETTAADSRFYLNEFHNKLGIGVLQCDERILTKIITAASLIDAIDENLVAFQPLKTSGTLKALEK